MICKGFPSQSLNDVTRQSTVITSNKGLKIDFDHDILCSIMLTVRIHSRRGTYLFLLLLLYFLLPSIAFQGLYITHKVDKT